jgi:cupin 2 domain-containing protein
LVERLVDTQHVRIERIVSKGHRSPLDFWYDQAENEWVLLVKGEAALRFEKNNELIHLRAGMHVNIAAHEKHRVEWTSEEVETIWLAVFY